MSDGKLEILSDTFEMYENHLDDLLKRDDEESLASYKHWVENKEKVLQNLEGMKHTRIISTLMKKVLNGEIELDDEDLYDESDDE